MTNMKLTVAYATALLLVWHAVPASAQAASSTDSGAQNPSSVPVAPDSRFAKQPGTLSDKLDKSNGVIAPKEVDPAIEKKPPSTGTAVVIHPPGTPAEQPK